MMYNKYVVDCFFAPKHVGTLDISHRLTAHFRSTQTNQGILFDLYLQCTHMGNIEKARFKATGNPYVIAACEWLCRQIEGKSVFKPPLLDYQVLINVLEIPTIQYPVALQVEDAYKEVLTLLKYKLED